jgi:hypothetical protein
MDDVSVEVRRYFRYLRRYWWVVLAGAAVGLVAIFVLNRLTSDSTVSSSTQQVAILSERWTGMSSVDEPGTVFAEDPDTLAVAVARVASDESLAEAESRFGIPAKGFTFSLDGRRVLIDIDTDTDTAKPVAEWLRSKIDAARVTDTLVPINLAIQAREERLADSTGAQPTETDRLQTELTLLRAAAAAVPTELQSNVQTVKQLSSASVVSGEFSPTQALLGVIGGMILAAVAIIVWSVLDRRLATRRDVEAIMGAGSLLAIVRTPPMDGDLEAAAAAITHLRPQHPTLSLVPLRDSAEEVAGSVASRSATPCVALDDILHGETPISCVPVARTGTVTATDIERLQLVVERAGGTIPGLILVGDRRQKDLLD